MKLLLLPVLLLGMLAGMFHRPKWDDATALDRLRAGTMTDEEKQFRGYYPHHGGAIR